LLVWGLVSLPWYLVHAPSLAQDFLGYGPNSPTDWRSFPLVLSLPGLSFYPRAVASLMLLPWAAVLLIGGALAWRRYPEARRLFLLSIAGLLFLTLFRTKDERYAMPVLPAAAVLATAWAGDPRNKSLRTRLLVVGSVALASLALAAIRDPPIRQLWPIEETLAAISNRPSLSPPCVRVIPDLSCFHRFAFEYAAEAGGRSLEIEGAGRIPWFTDGVIVKTGDQGARPGAALIMDRIARNEGGFHEIFRKSWEHSLPDGSNVEVYTRDVRPLEGIAPQELVEKLRSAVQNEISRTTHTPFVGRIDIDPTSDEETLRGRFRRIAFSAENMTIAGRSPGDPAIVAREIGFELFGVAVNPYRLRDGELELLSLEELAPHVLIREDDASLWLSAAARDGGARMTFRDGSIHASVHPERGPALELVVAPRIVAGSAGSNLGLDFESVHAAGMRIPTFLVSALASQYNPILKQMPCRVRIATLACGNGILTISGRSGGQGISGSLRQTMLLHRD
ncbi:MAG TPA: LmeA family phospholipid-binding protein, partial [Thermoanaerobaculia bacterium]|nr:LmeA family phospholipid-binding protein [Thermoanaerobaculia bacterium]